MKPLPLTERALGILQVPHAIGGVRPEGVPQGHDDLLLGIDGLLELGQHPGGGGGQELHVPQTVGWDHVLLRHLGQTRTRLDTDDLVADLRGVWLDVLDRLHGGVVRDGPAQLGRVVVGPQILDVGAVLVHVALLGDVRPRRGEEVDRPLAEARIQRSGLTEIHELDLVAGLLQLGLDQVGHGQPIAP